MKQIVLLSLLCVGMVLVVTGCIVVNVERNPKTSNMSPATNAPATTNTCK